MIPVYDQLEFVVDKIATTLSQPEDQVRLMVVFLLQYPLGWFMHFCLFGTKLRHWFNVVAGLTIQIYLFGWGVKHVFLMSGVTYLIMLMMPRFGQQTYVAAWVFTYLSYTHISRMIMNYGGFDFEVSTYTMLLVCKLSSLAFCYRDGGYNERYLSPEQQKWRVNELPTVLEMASYTFFSSACALGIFFEFSDYKRFIERKEEYAYVPSPVLPSLKVLAQGVFCLVVFLVVSSTFSVIFCGTSEYAHIGGFGYRVFYYMVAMTGQRFFYYAPWLFTQGAVVASGFGYNGRDNKRFFHKWDKVVQIQWMELETAVSPIEFLRFWNHQVHVWLKYYVSARLTPYGKRPSAAVNMATFMVSGFWHGFYPFYYIVFFLCAVTSEANKDIFKSKILFNQFIPGPLRNFVANQISFLTFNYFGIMFAALTFERGYNFVAATYAFVPIYVCVFVFLSRTFNLVGIAKKKEKALAAKKNKKD